MSFNKSDNGKLFEEVHFVMCMGVLLACMSVTMIMPGYSGGQKMASESLELKMM